MNNSIRRAAILRYFNEVWNAGRLDVLDELLTPDYLNHHPSTPDPERGPAGLKPIVAAMRAGVPDLHYDILDLVDDGERVAVYLQVTGTHSGELFGMPASGRAFNVRQMQIERFEGGRIAEHWRLTDELSLLRQLGAA